MRAILYETFGATPHLVDVPAPEPSASGVVVRVETTGLCRSDLFGWQGKDKDIVVPHVPGHELVGTIARLGPEVTRFHIGQRVTVPFVCACGHCPECDRGQGQVCRNQTQPGFTHWGSYAEEVAIHNADVNLIAVPDAVDGGAAALLGCRFATAFHGLTNQGKLQPGETLLVVGCGGVGLSAVMIGVALGARVIGVDISPAALERAKRFGAAATIDSTSLSRQEILHAIRHIAPEGVDVSVEALGREETVATAISALGIQGRHVQIGLLAEDPRIPMPAVIAKELSVLGSHGMAAHGYPALLDLIATGALRPQDLIDTRIRLEEVPATMEAMRTGRWTGGVTVIDVAPH
ncbi:MAG: alcohol dehydrogenase catalytic domain-containing protein [Thermomicrobiales bacterium]